MSSSNLLFRNGFLLHHGSDSTPNVTTLLESHSGAYTTTRTHESASSLLFWDRHVLRLCDSLKILCEKKPEFLFGKEMLDLSKFPSSVWIPVVKNMVEYSVDEAMRVARRRGRSKGEELALTALVSGNAGRLIECRGGDVGADMDEICRCFDFYVHVGIYDPGLFGVGGARLALLGRGREVATAKYSDWARLLLSVFSSFFVSMTGYETQREVQMSLKEFDLNTLYVPFI